MSLPENWELVKLEDYLDIKGGSQPPKSEFIYEPQDGYIRLLQIRDFGKKPVPTYVKKDDVTKFCEKEDILIARYGASLGRIVTGMEGAYNVALAKVIVDDEDFKRRYLFYLLQTQIFQTPLTMISRSAQNGFAKHEISKIELPKPPRPTQHRIVEKIEELFSELDNGVENLKKAQKQLKTYRQAVLKDAFEGKLTKEWRDQQENLPTPEELLEQIKAERKAHRERELAEWEKEVAQWEKDGKPGSKPRKPRKARKLPPITEEELDSLPELPPYWTYMRNEECISEVKDGTHDTPDYVDKGIPFITQKNIKSDKVDFSDTRYISQEEHQKFYKRSNVEKGDIIIAMIGHNRGNSTIVNTDKIFSIKNVGLFKFYTEFQNNRFYLYYYRSQDALNQILSKSKGGAQPFIGLTELRKWPVIICSKKEQDRIVEEIESRLSVVDQLEQTIKENLQKAEALRQSILKKAFGGELV